MSETTLSGVAFRDAMSRVAGAVHIIATDGKAGLGGATATSVTSVSASPPSLLLCLNQTSRTLDRIRENGVFSVNVLSAEQRDVADIFAGATGLEGAARFRVSHGWRMGDGPPILQTALVVLVCQLESMVPVGSHMVVIGTVLQAEVGGDQPPLIYHRRAYKPL
jgi:flavin reductase